MNKLYAFFAFSFVLCTILCGIMEGLAGISVTVLTSAIDEEAVTIPVESTEGFADASYPVSVRYISIRGETIRYTNITGTSFTGAVRGQANPRTGEVSEAIRHDEGDRVMNLSTSAMNELFSFMTATSTASFGSFVSFVFTGRFFTALWQMLMWDYSFFVGQLVIIRVTLVVVISGGFLFSIAMAMITLAQGLFRL